MVEGGVDHAIAGGRAPGQDIVVVQRAPRDLGADSRQLGRAGVGARQPQHLVTVGEQFLDDGGADEAGGAGDENTHGRELPGFTPATVRAKLILLK